MGSSLWLWITSAVAFLIVNCCTGQFGDFSNLRDFRLLTNTSFPSRGDNLTLVCRRTKSYFDKTSSNLLDQDGKITWEENNRALFSTAVDQDGRCRITRESSFLVSSSFGQNSPEDRLNRISCRDDGNTVRVTLYDWSPGQLAGDRWRCVQFPFSDSNDLYIQSFVPLVSATISQTIDKGDYYTPSRGTIVTCVTSPCRPNAYIGWFVESPTSGEMRLTSHSDIKENVDTNQDGLSVTVSSLLFTRNEDHGLRIYCKASNRENAFEAESDELTLVVTYPPTVSLQVKPDASVLEGNDVTLECSPSGRPVPEVKWIRRGGNSNKRGAKFDRVISLSLSVNLRSVSVADSGRYDCVATNGLEPDASESVVLLIRERPPSLPPATEQRDPSPSLQSSPASSSSSSSSVPSSSSSKLAVDGGAVAGIVIAVILVVIIVGIVVFLMLRKRWGKQDIVVREVNSFRSAGILDTEGQGIYAMCSSLPRMCELPPYMDLLPPSYPERKLPNVANPGYGMDDQVIGGSASPNSRRPLPRTPYDADLGYEEINDVTLTTSPISSNQNGAGGSRRQPISVQDNDAYEVPVTPSGRNPPNALYDSTTLIMSRAPTEKSASRDRTSLKNVVPTGSGIGNDHHYYAAAAAATTGDASIPKADDSNNGSNGNSISNIWSRTDGKRLSQESELNTPL